MQRPEQVRGLMTSYPFRLTARRWLVSSPLHGIDVRGLAPQVKAPNPCHPLTRRRAYSIRGRATARESYT